MKTPDLVAAELVAPTAAMFVAAAAGEYLDAASELERAAQILREAEEEREHQALNPQA